jgi:hypothetical protein
MSVWDREYYLRFRRQYEPENVRLVIVAESPPAVIRPAILTPASGSNSTTDTVDDRRPGADVPCVRSDLLEAMGLAEMHGFARPYQTA